MESKVKQFVIAVAPVALAATAASALAFSEEHGRADALGMGTRGDKSSASPSPSSSPSPTTPPASPSPKPSPIQSGSDLFGDTFGPFTIDGFRPGNIAKAIVTAVVPATLITAAVCTPFASNGRVGHTCRCASRATHSLAVAKLPKWTRGDGRRPPMRISGWMSSTHLKMELIIGANGYIGRHLAWSRRGRDCTLHSASPQNADCARTASICSGEPGGKREHNSARSTLPRCFSLLAR